MLGLKLIVRVMGFMDYLAPIFGYRVSLVHFLFFPSVLFFAFFLFFNRRFRIDSIYIVFINIGKIRFLDVLLHFPEDIVNFGCSFVDTLFDSRSQSVSIDLHCFYIFEFLFVQKIDSSDHLVDFLNF